MDLTEYVEKFVADGFKREVDQEENVARSLPFFAASLALIAAIIGAFRSTLPPLSWTLYSVIVWAIVALLAVFIVGAILYLWRAVRRRDFLYPQPETDFRDWVESLRTYYAATGSTNPDGDTLKDIRAGIIDQQAKAAVNNRAINAARVVARAHALSNLIAALALAFVLTGLMLLHDEADGAAHAGTATRANAVPAGTAGINGTSSDKAGNASDADRQQGRAVGPDNSKPDSPPDAGGKPK